MIKLDIMTLKIIQYQRWNDNFRSSNNNLYDLRLEAQIKEKMNRYIKWAFKGSNIKLGIIFIIIIYDLVIINLFNFGSTNFEFFKSIVADPNIIVCLLKITILCNFSKKIICGWYKHWILLVFCNNLFSIKIANIMKSYYFY